MELGSHTDKVHAASHKCQTCTAYFTASGLEVHQRDICPHALEVVGRYQCPLIIADMILLSVFPMWLSIQAQGYVTTYNHVCESYRTM